MRCLLTGWQTGRCRRVKSVYVHVHGSRRVVAILDFTHTTVIHSPIIGRHSGRSHKPYVHACFMAMCAIFDLVRSCTYVIPTFSTIPARCSDPVYNTHNNCTSTHCMRRRLSKNKAKFECVRYARRRGRTPPHTYRSPVTETLVSVSFPTHSVMRCKSAPNPDCAIHNVVSYKYSEWQRIIVADSQSMTSNVLRWSVVMQISSKRKPDVAESDLRVRLPPPPLLHSLHGRRSLHITLAAVFLFAEHTNERSSAVLIFVVLYPFSPKSRLTLVRETAVPAPSDRQLPCIQHGAPVSCAAPWKS